MGFGALVQVPKALATQRSHFQNSVRRGARRGGLAPLPLAARAAHANSLWFGVGVAGRLSAQWIFIAFTTEVTFALSKTLIFRNDFKHPNAFSVSIFVRSLLPHRFRIYLSAFRRFVFIFATWPAELQTQAQRVTSELLRLAGKKSMTNKFKMFFNIFLKNIRKFIDFRKRVLQLIFCRRGINSETITQTSPAPKQIKL